MNLIISLFLSGFFIFSYLLILIIMHKKKKSSAGMSCVCAAETSERGSRDRFVAALWGVYVQQWSIAELLNNKNTS